MRIYYELETVYDDETYFPIQNKLVELLDKYNWEFTTEQKREFVDELKHIDDIRVYETGTYITFNNSNFRNFLSEFLDTDNLEIKTYKKRVGEKVVKMTKIIIF